MSEPIIIKKYANRRLYNTATSKYIVLSDIEQLIKDGTDFQIEDAKTGEDITRSILNQIIFEQENSQGDFMFPLEFQKQLIAMYNDSYASLLPDFLTQSMSVFAKERATIYQNLQEMMSKNTANFFEQSQAIANRNMELFQQSMSLFMGNQMQDSTEAETPEEAQEEDGTLDALQEQLNALKSQLDALQKGPEK